MRSCRASVAIPMPRFQDVMPLPDRPGFGIIPFPPLPAIVLLPAVLVWGEATNQGLIAVVLGAINVGLCWRMLTRVTDDATGQFRCDALLRLRHRPLVRGDAGQHLVLRPRRGDHVPAAGHHRRARRRAAGAGAGADRAGRRARARAATCSTRCSSSPAWSSASPRWPG